MHDARRLGAFVSGFFLYVCAIACATLLADFHLPRGLQGPLGGRASLGVMVAEAVLIALLLFVVSLVWSYVSIKPTRKSRRIATSWFFSGVGTAWMGGLVYGAFDFALHPRSYQSMSSLLLTSGTPPLWGLLNIVAIVCAALIARAVAHKLNPKVARSYSRKVRTAGPTTTLPA